MSSLPPDEVIAIGAAKQVSILHILVLNDASNTLLGFPQITGNLDSVRPLYLL
jgi:hypothetical protein